MNKFYSLLWYFSNSQDNLHRFYRKYYPVRHSKPLNHTTNVHWKAEIGTSKKHDKCSYKCFKNPESWVQGSLRQQRERTLLDIKTLACNTHGCHWHTQCQQRQVGNERPVQRVQSCSHLQTGALTWHWITQTISWGPRSSSTGMSLVLFQALPDHRMLGPSHYPSWRCYIWIASTCVSEWMNDTQHTLSVGQLSWGTKKWMIILYNKEQAKSPVKYTPIQEESYPTILIKWSLTVRVISTF